MVSMVTENFDYHGVSVMLIVATTYKSSQIFTISAIHRKQKKESIVKITIHLQIYNFKFKTLNFKQNKTL